jgi:hypothetical protein
MISSGSKGFCTVCNHANDVHHNVTCIARGCRKKIKVCGSLCHGIVHQDGSTDDNYSGYVVCRPCPEHGRCGKTVDYSEYPVVASSGNDDGRLMIVQYGVGM